MPSRKASRCSLWSHEGEAESLRRAGAGQGDGGAWCPSDPPPRRPEEAGAEVPLLPLDALHVLAEQLDKGDLEQALLLLKLFIILCR